MSKRPLEIDELADDDAVDVSNDVAALEFARAQKAAAEADEDDDDDDLDAEGLEDDDDDADDDDADDTDADADADADDDSDDDDSDDDDDDDDDDLTKIPPTGQKRKKKKLATRFSELTAARRKAEKEAFDAEMRAIEAERVASELRAKTATPDAVPAPDPKDFVYGEVDPDYQEALIDHRVAKKLAETQQSSATQTDAQKLEAANQAYAAKLAASMEQGKKKHVDFEEAVNSVQFDAHLARLVLDSENPVDIAYFLSKNVGELLKVTKSAPEDRARMIGRLEGKFSAPSAVRKKKTNAPKPLRSSRKKAPKENGEFGPSDQDAFDKAFYG